MAEFKESEHPRDKDGKFANKGAIRKEVIQRLRENHTARKQQNLKLNLQFFSEEALKNQTNREIKKGIRTLNKRIAEHQEKIANPWKLFPEWQTFSDDHKQKQLNHWKSEINSFLEAIKNREDEIEKRGSNGT